MGSNSGTNFKNLTMRNHASLGEWRAIIKNTTEREKEKRGRVDKDETHRARNTEMKRYTKTTLSQTHTHTHTEGERRGEPSCSDS